ncbi:hypothetical protein KSP39_PZI021916 [Platanthera zijinensis]|uniref:Uncharacterized protein n=1 Tax=Platanthera zijinensis TaxID=2320716 RepID=A0AAP0AY52_9ASPA
MSDKINILDLILFKTASPTGKKKEYGSSCFSSFICAVFYLLSSNVEFLVILYFCWLEELLVSSATTMVCEYECHFFDFFLIHVSSFNLLVRLLHNQFAQISTPSPPPKAHRAYFNQFVG